MKIIDLKKPRTGRVTRTTKMGSVFVEWHYDTLGERMLLPSNMKEIWYGSPRYRLVK